MLVKLKSTIKCHDLYKEGKYKKANQKYFCKKCRRQFILQLIKKLNNPKYPFCDKVMYLHHKYKYNVGFKYYNHIIKHLTHSDIDNSSSENLLGKNTFQDIN